MYVDILQKKTRTAVIVGIINSLAIQIIIHNFQYVLEIDTLTVIYKKEVIEIAGIHEEMKGYQ